MKTLTTTSQRRCCALSRVVTDSLLHPPEKFHRSQNHFLNFLNFPTIPNTFLFTHSAQCLSLCSGQESHCRTYPRDPFAWQAVGIRQAHCHTNVPNLHETTKFTASFQFFQFHSFTQSSTVVCCPVTRSSHQKDLAPMRHRIEGFQDTFDLRQRLRSDLKPKCPMSLDFF